MSAVAVCLSKIALGEPQSHRDLSLHPLLGDGVAEPAYLLLDEALKAGCARVTEVSESGSVPELRFVNDCNRPVLLLDGEELVGAKQNRILNLSVLAPAHKSIVIPVSCVEAGRWHAESAQFGSAMRTHYASGRAEKAAQVSASLHTSGSRHSDQSQVWDHIAAKAERMATASPTGAAAALYETHRSSLDDYRHAFAAVPAQLGALFLLNGEVIGLDLFDSARTLSALLPKLIESAALDAIDVGESGAAVDGQEAAGGFLEAVSHAEIERFPAIGEGEDLRLRHHAVAGGALVAAGNVVHLCAFHIQPGEGAGTGPQGGRIVRASQRRRGRL